MDKNGYDYNAPYTSGPYTGTVQGPVTPGKNITSLVLGIHSLYFAVMAVMFCWPPFYGIIMAFMFGAFSIGCTIATSILTKQIVEITGDLTQKPAIGKKLATAGLIVSIIAIILSIVIFVVILLLFGATFITSFVAANGMSGY